MHIIGQTSVTHLQKDSLLVYRTGYMKLSLGLKEAGLKLDVTTWVPFLQSVYALPLEGVKIAKVSMVQF